MYPSPDPDDRQCPILDRIIPESAEVCVCVWVVEALVLSLYVDVVMGAGCCPDSAACVCVCVSLVVLSSTVLCLAVT